MSEKLIERVSYDDLLLAGNPEVKPGAIYDWVKPITDTAAADVSEHFFCVTRRWRHLADDHQYDGPIAWRVKPGYTLKIHAPQTGPCYENLWYLQTRDFEDHSTGDWLVFWVPKLLESSLGLSPKKQLQVLKTLGEQYQLPGGHLSGFGQASLIAGLMLSWYQDSGQAPLDPEMWVRTDTHYQKLFRLNLCFDPGTGLCTDGAMFRADNRYYSWNAWSLYVASTQGNGLLGVFPLGIEPFPV